MPIPFIVAGAALLGGAAAGAGAAAAAVAGCTAAEVVGAAVAGGIVGEMLSDDDEPKTKTTKEKIDKSQVPPDVLEMLEKNPQNTYRSANGISYCCSAGNFFRF